MKAAIDQARHDVEATERTWGGIGTFRRDRPPVVPAAEIAASVQRCLARSAAEDRRRDAQVWEALRFVGHRMKPEIQGTDVGSVVPDVAWVERGTGRAVVLEAKSTGVLKWEAYERFLSELCGAVVVVGPPGTGKTTLVAQVARQLAEQQDAERPRLTVHTVHDLVAEASAQVQLSFYAIVAGLRLVGATEFHVLRQRDGAVEVMPLPEDEPGEDSQVALTAPTSPNAPPGRARALAEMDGYLAA